jgi:hypothetical protein
MGAAPPTPEATQEKPPRRLRKLIGSTWSLAGTGVALATGAVALAFTLWPALTPDPRTMLSASVIVEAVEPGVTLGSYLARYEPAQLKGRLTEPQTTANRQPGDIVFLHVQVQGRKHGTLTLDTFTYDWATKRATSPDETPVGGRGFKPDTPDDQWIAPVWVADPQLGEPFFVRLSILDRGVLLAFADTKRISPQ